MPRAGGPAGDARLLVARDQVADEIAALRLAQNAPAAERLRFLADLATRLDALLAGRATRSRRRAAPTSTRSGTRRFAC
jgi:hypothetical protein